LNMELSYALEGALRCWMQAPGLVDDTKDMEINLHRCESQSGTIMCTGKY
jgi:hypothetical protein